MPEEERRAKTETVRRAGKNEEKTSEKKTGLRKSEKEGELNRKKDNKTK